MIGYVFTYPIFILQTYFRQFSHRMKFPIRQEKVHIDKLDITLSLGL